MGPYAKEVRHAGGLARGGDLFYIINNLFPGDPIEPGKQYKIVTLQ